LTAWWREQGRIEDQSGLRVEQTDPVAGAPRIHRFQPDQAQACWLVGEDQRQQPLGVAARNDKCPDAQ